MPEKARRFICFKPNAEPENPRWATWLSAVGYLAVSLILLSLNATYVFVSDRAPWGEFFTIWPPLFYAVGLIPFLVLCSFAVSGKKRLFLWGLWLIFLLSTEEWRSLVRFPDAGLTAQFDRLHRTPGGTEEGCAIRLVSWNITGASPTNPSVLDFLSTVKPDVCVFQEASADVPDRTGERDLPGLWSDFQVLVSGELSLLTRFGAIEMPTKKIGPWSLPQMAILKISQERNILITNVRLLLPSLILNPLTPNNRQDLMRNRWERIGQFPKLADLVKAGLSDRQKFTAILAGDFNTPAAMWSLHPLKEFMVDSWKVGGSGWGRTMTNSFPVSRIDQCWVTPDIRVVRATVHRADLSDHRLLVVDLIIP